MQGELSADVVILGVNEVGHESGNEGFCEGRDLPWLQDTEAADVWSAWGVVYRDVIVVDREGAYVDRFNLSDNDLGEEANWDHLEALLLSVE